MTAIAKLARCCAALIALAIILLPPVARAQAPATQNIPAKLDTTTLGTNERAVYRVWQLYLDSKSGKRAQRLDKPSPYWLRAEQQQWKAYDMAGMYLDNDAQPTVLSITQVGTRGDSVYRIITHFSPKGNIPTADVWRNSMTITSYGVRDGAEWKISGAMPRVIANWKRDTVGPMTYTYAPTYPYSRARALHALAFVDSVAAVFGMPRFAPITYFLASDANAMYAIFGLESEVKSHEAAGLASPVNRQLFSGFPGWGEEYRHELVHLVVAPLTENSLYIVNEGVATWLGGTIGLTYAQSLKGLGEFLREHPNVTLDSIVNHVYPQTVTYRAGALLMDIVHEKAGVPAVRSMFAASDLRASVEQLTGMTWAAVVAEWRRRALRAATPN
jgi:hypothetical protein